jgi:hypothetical protein
MKNSNDIAARPRDLAGFPMRCKRERQRGRLFLKPNDQVGNEIRAGDWMRLVEIPPGISKLPSETQVVFRKAQGKTFKVGNGLGWKWGLEMGSGLRLYFAINQLRRGFRSFRPLF